MSTLSTTEKRKVTFSIGKELYKRLQHHCINAEIKQSEVIEKALENYLPAN